MKRFLIAVLFSSGAIILAGGVALTAAASVSTVPEPARIANFDDTTTTTITNPRVVVTPSTIYDNGRRDPQPFDDHGRREPEDDDRGSSSGRGR